MTSGYGSAIADRSHTVPWVVLDTTVLGGHDRYLESAAARVLLDEANVGRLRLAVPEIVMREAEAKHRREVRSAQDKFAAARAALAALRAPQGGDLISPDRGYRQDLEEILNRVGAKVLPIPDVPHGVLVNWAVQRRRPFDLNGDGYRDALVWVSVLDLLERGADPVVLISGDRAAFSAAKDTPLLAPELVNELTAQGHAGRLAYHFEIAEFTASLPEARRLVDDWNLILTQNRELADAMTAYCIELAEEEATALIGGLYLPEGARNARFVDFSNPRDLRVAEAWASPEGGAVLDVSLALSYKQQYDTLLPGNAAGLQPEATRRANVTTTSAIVLTYEIMQRDRRDPTRFAGRLVGWHDLSRLATQSAGGKQ